jgi:hypothetical protein
MKVSFHVDFRKDLEGFLDIELGITGIKHPRQLTFPIHITKAIKSQLKKTLENSNYDYDLLDVPKFIVDAYKPIFIQNKNVLIRTKRILELKWRTVEKRFFRNINSVFGLKINIPLKCYVVYSYNSIGGTHTKGVFLVGYKVSNVDTVAHEIIHIYLDELGIAKKLNNNHELIELLTRIIEYKTVPHKKIEFFPHWLKGITSKQVQILNSEPINLHKANLKDIIKWLKKQR